MLSSGAGNTVGNLAFSLRAATTDTNLTERMRLDYTGNLIVGGTASQANNAVTMTAAGLVYSSRNGDVSGHFNRQTSYGAIVNFSKDGTTVGVISAIDSGGSQIVMANANTGLCFRDNQAAILPATSTTNDRDWETIAP